MKRILMALTIIFVILAFNGLMASDHPAAPEVVPSTEFPTEIVEVLAKTCPVMGGGTSKAVFTINNGHIYYFCCPGCIGAFNSAPEKYLEKIKDAPTKTLKVTNVEGKCPVSGLEANLNFFKIDEEASTITFFHDQENMETSKK